jgi:hypothetical protein
MGEDTTIRVSKALADDLYDRKGREMSYAEFVRELVELYDAVEAGEQEPTSSLEPDSETSPTPETAAAKDKTVDNDTSAPETTEVSAEDMEWNPSLKSSARSCQGRET